MFQRLGRSVDRARWLVVAAWAVAAVAALFAPSLSSVGAAEETSFLPRTAESMQARSLLASSFPSETSAGTATVVLRRDGGLSDGDRVYARVLGDWLLSSDAPPAIRDAVTSVDSAENHPTLAGMYRSRDGTTELLQVRLRTAAFQSGASDAIALLRDHLAASAPTGLAAHVTGTAGIGADYLGAIERGTDSTTAVTIVLVVVILLLIYRAPLAALVPLATIGAAFAVARGLMGLLAQAGWQIPTLLDSFVVVLVFGVGTDYTIFLISRYREEAARQAQLGTAITTTVERIGAVISASAATVVVGLGSMVVASFGLIGTIGPALALAILVTLAAGLTLAPALSRACGRWLWWPRADAVRDATQPSRRWSRLASTITQRPGVVAGAVIAMLAIPLLWLPSLQLNFDMLSELPADSDARAGYDQVAATFGRGEMLPISVLVRSTAGTDLSSPAGLETLQQVAEELRSTDGVASVRSLVTPSGDGVVPAALRPSEQIRAAAQSLSGGGNVIDTLAILDDPATLTALDRATAYVGSVGAAFPDIARDQAFRELSTDIASARGAVANYQAASAGSSERAAAMAALSSLASRLADEAGAVATLLEARPDDLLLPEGASADPQLSEMVGRFLAPGGAVSRLFVVTSEDPYTPAAFETVSRIRGALADGSISLPVPVATVVGGATAESADVQATISDDFKRVAVITLLGILVVLALLLRSLVAPLFLVLTVLLSYGTTLGLVTLLFQDVLGAAGINYFVPIIVFVLLVALGSDYNIFLMSRIREESARIDLRAGITTASARTGTVITSAGIILAGTFGALMVSPLQILFQTGAAVGLGVLIDTFLVRSLLIPALTTLFGERSWWPSHGRGRAVVNQAREGLGAS